MRDGAPLASAGRGRGPAARAAAALRGAAARLPAAAPPPVARGAAQRLRQPGHRQRQRARLYGTVLSAPAPVCAAATGMDYDYEALQYFSK